MKQMKHETTVLRGKRGEDAAAEYLSAHGCTVLARNVRLAHGEIDLIASDHEHLLFVEVKTRTVSSDAAFGTPASAVTREKQARIISAAEEYLRRNPTELFPRLDVCEVLLSRGAESRVLSVSYLENAFYKQ